MGNSKEKGIFREPLLRQLLIYGLEIAVFLTAVFSLHRAAAWSFIAHGLTPHHKALPWLFLTGMGSDLWLGLVLAFLFIFCAAPLALGGKAKALQWGAVLWILFWGGLTAAHQPYVEYFGFQFIPFHFKYLIDPDFMRSSATTLMSAKSALLLGVAVAGALSCGRWGSWWPRSATRVALCFVALVGLATAAHSANIHYRVQLFLPTELQMNYLEHLYQHLMTAGTPAPLTATEATALKAALGADEQASWNTILRQPPRPSSDPVFKKLHSLLQARIVAGKKPLLLTVLTESMRPAETGIYRHDPQSLTPHFDAFAQDGVLFTHAYSSSNVTRGGQEAVWCGYPASVVTSMMRDRPDIHLPCLPQVLANAQPGQPTAATLWLHGGRSAFDGQVAFWQRHVAEILAGEDFPADAPHNDWGVSDRRVAAMALDKIAATRSKTDKDLLFAMFLTVTNHVPWQLPSDAPVELQQDPRFARHNSHRSSAYADLALGDLIAGLKAKGMWDDTVMIVVSDHGIQAPPYYEDALTAGADHSEFLSHINLALGGGLVHQALAGAPAQAGQYDGYVGQMDIAAFWAALTDRGSFLSFGDPLLTGERRAPLFSDFGPHLYFPTLQLTLPRREAFAASQSGSPQEQTARAYARAVYTWLNQEAPRLKP